MFEPAQGRWVNQKIPTKAQVTYTAGMMVYNDATNNVPAVDATQQNVRGILLEAKASSATTTSIHARVPSGTDCTFYADMESGETITKANEGTPFDFADGGLTVSTASTYDAVTLIKYLTTGTGEFAMNITTGVEN